MGIGFSFSTVEDLGLLIFFFKPRALRSFWVNFFAKSPWSLLPLPLPFPPFPRRGGELPGGLRSNDSSGPELLLVLVAVERYEG